MSKATLHYRKNAGGGVWRLSFVDHARRRREVKLYPQKEPSETARAMACQGDEKRGQLYGQKMGEEWPKTANFDGGATGRAAVRKTGAGAIAGTTGKPGKTPLKPVSQWVEYWETSGAHNDFCHLGSAVEQCFRKA